MYVDDRMNKNIEEVDSHAHLVWSNEAIADN